MFNYSRVFKFFELYLGLKIKKINKSKIELLMKPDFNLLLNFVYKCSYHSVTYLLWLLYLVLFLIFCLLIKIIFYTYRELINNYYIVLYVYIIINVALLLGYDGPLTYAMMNCSPDSSDVLGVSRHSINHDVIEGL